MGDYIVAKKQDGTPFARACMLTATLILASFMAPQASFAQERTDANVQKAVQPTPGLTLNVTPSQPASFLESMEFVDLGASMQGTSIELPVEAVGSRLFNLDAGSSNCLLGEKGCLRRDDTVDLGYSRSIIKSLDTTLDIELMPRASLRFDDESSSAVVGALVRIGDDLRDDSDLASNTWYMFAGADAEAVTYEPNSISRLTRGQLHLQDRIIVGDAQAGVGYRIGDADVSLGYFRREVTSFGREVESNSVSFSEDAAALSFTWRR
jgi:hypothetical protein